MWKARLILAAIDFFAAYGTSAKSLGDYCVIHGNAIITLYQWETEGGPKKIRKGHTDMGILGARSVLIPCWVRFKIVNWLYTTETPIYISLI